MNAKLYIEAFKEGKSQGYVLFWDGVLEMRFNKADAWPFFKDYVAERIAQICADGWSRRGFSFKVVA